MKRDVPWDVIMQILTIHLRDGRHPAVSEVAKKTQDPFKVLVSTVISLRTKDEVTHQASRRLLCEAGTPEALRGLSEARISELIYPAGFYNTKARHLKRIADILVEEYEGRVPSEMDALLQLPGVGRKTANLVRNEGYGLPGICVDTHVHRISNRLGWVCTKSPVETEKALEQVLPGNYWIAINGLLVGFGQRTCKPVSPHCSGCPLQAYCPKRGVARHR
jgi:endonuclease-3